MELKECDYLDHVALRCPEVLTYISRDPSLLGSPQRSLDHFYVKKVSSFTSRKDTYVVKKSKVMGVRQQ